MTGHRASSAAVLSRPLPCSGHALLIIYLRVFGQRVRVWHLVRGEAVRGVGGLRGLGWW
jgi:hypothetical protein